MVPSNDYSLDSEREKTLYLHSFLTADGWSGWSVTER